MIEEDSSSSVTTTNYGLFKWQFGFPFALVCASPFPFWAGRRQRKSVCSTNVGEISARLPFILFKRSRARQCSVQFQLTNAIHLVYAASAEHYFRRGGMSPVSRLVAASIDPSIPLLLFYLRDL